MRFFKYASMAAAILVDGLVTPVTQGAVLRGPNVASAESDDPDKYQNPRWNGKRRVAPRLGCIDQRIAAERPVPWRDLTPRGKDIAQREQSSHQVTDER